MFGRNGKLIAWFYFGERLKNDRVILLKMKQVPSSLRMWFAFHFIADMLFAIPLMIAPVWMLSMLGFMGADVLVARLVAAAFIGIGGTSLLLKNKGWETYDTMLTLKIVWSSSAILGTILSIAHGTSPFAWVVLGIFVLFFVVWVYYKRRL